MPRRASQGRRSALASAERRWACSTAAWGCSEAARRRAARTCRSAATSRSSKLEADVALRDANTYGDQKLLEMYKYIDGQLKEIRGTICQQAVHNQRTEDSFTLVRQDVASVKQECMSAVAQEAERRCCGDNSIVTYANATFYPKQVADVTTGTATTAQTLYNPLPKCGCCNS